MTVGVSHLKVGLLGIARRSNGGPPYRLYQIGSALPIALEDAEENLEVLPDLPLTTFTMRDDNCSPTKALQEMIKLVQVNKVDAIVGPSCSSACEAVSYLAASQEWNLPIISYLCGADSLSNKDAFPTFARTADSTISVIKSVQLILKKYDWNFVGMAWNQDVGYLVSLASHAEQQLLSKNITIALQVGYSEAKAEHPEFFLELLMQFSKSVRGE